MINVQELRRRTDKMFRVALKWKREHHPKQRIPLEVKRQPNPKVQAYCKILCLQTISKISEQRIIYNFRNLCYL